MNIRELAVKHLDRADGDVLAATDTMQKQIMSDLDRFKEFVRPLIYSGCYNNITKVQRERRLVVWNPEQPSKTEVRKRVEALAVGTKNSLLFFPLPNGLYLKDAKRPDVLAAASMFGKPGRDMIQKEQWLKRIGAEMPNDTVKVGKVLSEARLLSLKNSANMLQAAE